MDRIIITDFKIFLQKDPVTKMGKLQQFKQVELLIAEQAPELQTLLSSLKEILQYRFDAQQKPLQEEIFLISQAISADPLDSTISRIANTGLPLLTDFEEFQLKVIVKHYDIEGNYLAGLDKLITLTADNTTRIPISATDTIGEYDYLKGQIESGANLFHLTKQMILLRDSEGRFN